MKPEDVIGDFVSELNQRPRVKDQGTNDVPRKKRKWSLGLKVIVVCVALVVLATGALAAIVWLSRPTPGPVQTVPFSMTVTFSGLTNFTSNASSKVFVVRVNNPNGNPSFGSIVLNITAACTGPVTLSVNDSTHSSANLCALGTGFEPAAQAVASGITVSWTLTEAVLNTGAVNGSVQLTFRVRQGP